MGFMSRVIWNEEKKVNIPNEELKQEIEECEDCQDSMGGYCIVHALECSTPTPDKK